MRRQTMIFGTEPSPLWHIGVSDRGQLWFRLKDEVERCLSRPAKTRESRLGDHFAKPFLACLSAQGKTDFLADRRRGADHRREAIEHPADGIEILEELVVGKRFDEQ